jgi:Holliday junction resolvase RusA-like endonuclease
MAGVAVSVNLEARVSVPASWSKRKRAAALEGEIKPTSRPDIDNFAKAATDGMNGIVYVDDAQIVRLDAQKHYAETPGLLVYVTMA